MPQLHVGIGVHCLSPPGCEGEGLEGVRGHSSRVAWAAAGQEHPLLMKWDWDREPGPGLGVCREGRGNKAVSIVHIISG